MCKSFVRLAHSLLPVKVLMTLQAGEQRDCSGRRCHCPLQEALRRGKAQSAGFKEATTSSPVNVYIICEVVPRYFIIYDQSVLFKSKESKEISKVK